MCKINTPVYLYMYEVDKLKHYGAVQMSGQCKKMISISYLGKKIEKTLIEITIRIP